MLLFQLVGADVFMFIKFELVHIFVTLLQDKVNFIVDICDQTHELTAQYHLTFEKHISEL
jgi:hypothetical protein